jgi:hypothetical protein
LGEPGFERFDDGKPRRPRVESGLRFARQASRREYSAICASLKREVFG